jgi:DNA-binding response OmpR family regulator
LYLEYDKEKLRQIVSNLLSNAIKFTPEQGNIYISVLVEKSTAIHNLSLRTQHSADTSTLVIKVKDTGIGIPEDKIHHIFDRFYQLDNSHTRSAGGTGIGLALTKELVKLMNGDISVKSPPAGIARGAEFSVAITFRNADPETADIDEDLKSEPDKIAALPAKSIAPVYQSDADRKNANAPLILLVEDNADVVAYTASCLPDYRLAVGKDGREGLEIAVDMIPDLIITDVMMPFMDGFELAAKLRENEFTSHIPVIMLTAKADLASKIEGLQRGAEAYLEKPFIKEELLVRVRQLLDLRKNLQAYYMLKAGLGSSIEAAGPELNNEISGTGERRIPVMQTMQHHQGLQQAAASTTKPEDLFVTNVREIIEHNMTDTNFTVERLCKMVFMSHSQLHRKLEAITGCSPNKFIRILRLKKAVELLPDTSKSIGSIALDCGYNDPGYFARVFRQEFNMTPQEWRTSRQQS